MLQSFSNLSAAKEANSTTAIRDRIGGSNLMDAFRFTLTQPSRFSVKFKSSAPGSSLKLIQDHNQNRRIDAGETLRSVRMGSEQKEVALPQVAAGTYYLQISTSGRTSSRYQLNLASSALPVSNVAAGLPQPPARSPSVIEEIVTLTNDFRRQNGLAPVTLNPLLQTAAQNQSQNMALQDYFDHTSPAGVTPGQRATAAGYRWSRVAENIGAGFTTASGVVQGWINSPGHRANLLDPKVTEIGVGYYFLPNDTGNENWNYYWTQVFAAPL